MENNLENKLSMYQKVQFYLTHHADETAAIPMVASLQTELDDQVNTVLALATIVDTDITGYTVDKQTKRTNLTQKILKLSTAIVAYASVNGNSILAEKCDESLSNMGYMRDNDFYTFAQLIIKEAMPIMTDLAPFGVLPTDLSAAAAASEIYLDNIQSPRGQINERSKALADLEKEMEATDDLVRNKLDKVMGIFQATNPSLHVGYLGARSIDGTGSQTPADYEGRISAASIAVVATIPYLPSRSFEIQNLGTVPLTFALSTDAAVLNGVPVTVNAGAYVTRKSLNLNPSDAAEYVLLQNPDPSVSAAYKIWVTE
ncbi:hypothetical protein SAMN05421789_103193 [Kaistella chaponensis]|uniref:Uncharacterized protein n=1 Tax=Kaistella chaponensis TaxID=713588 RepID=A0A1N7KGR1_9FLAO|nr:hypothetical protein [Kaistella chaponensis]SIS60778.1 hypothetical protein SAMN05421789_103193 [Kaistella chaponensis]